MIWMPLRALGSEFLGALPHTSPTWSSPSMQPVGWPKKSGMKNKKVSGRMAATTFMFPTLMSASWLWRCCVMVRMLRLLGRKASDVKWQIGFAEWQKSTEDFFSGAVVGAAVDVGWYPYNK